MQRIGKQLAVVLSDDDIAIIDDLVAKGVFETRSEAVRALVHEALMEVSGRD